MFSIEVLDKDYVSFTYNIGEIPIVEQDKVYQSKVFEFKTQFIGVIES